MDDTNPNPRPHLPVLLQLRWQNPADPRESRWVTQADFADVESGLEWMRRYAERCRGECPAGWVPQIRRGLHDQSAGVAV